MLLMLLMLTMIPSEIFNVSIVSACLVMNDEDLDVNNYMPYF